MSLRPSELEALADHLLASDFKNSKRNKSQTMEYPILSSSQMKRRHEKEYPVSSLGKKQLLDAQSKRLDVEGEFEE